MTRLDVWLDDLAEPIGHLQSSSEGALAFQYTPAALLSGTDISLSLPLQDEPFADAVTRAFFDNLLPENDQLHQLMARQGLDRNDLVGILSLVGSDCSGALSCLPEGSPPIKIPGDLTADYEPISDGDLAEIVRRLANREPLPDDVRDRSPVAGVQSKFALTVLPSGAFGLPRADRGVPSTHILKVPRRSESAEAIQEDAASRLAEACDFETSNSRHITIDGHDALLIQRFDRFIIGDVVYRIHQEDFAQALGLPAQLKYERRGEAHRKFDATAAKTILERLSAPAAAIQTFIRSCFFNLAIGNNDNHAKNYGVLYLPGGARTLTPLYDLLPIAVTGNYTDELAFRVGEATTLAKMRRTDVEQFLAVFGLEGSSATRFIEGPVRKLLCELETRSRDLNRANLRKFDALIGQELSILSEILSLDLSLRERDAFVARGGGWSVS